MTKETLNDVLRTNDQLLFIIGNKFYSNKRSEVYRPSCDSFYVHDVYEFALTQIGKEYEYALMEINGFVDDTNYREKLLLEESYKFLDKYTD